MMDIIHHFSPRGIEAIARMRELTDPARGSRHMLTADEWANEVEKAFSVIDTELQGPDAHTYN